MITSDRQLKEAERKIELLRDSLKQKAKKDLPDKLLKAARGQALSLISDLGREIMEYQQLQKGVVEIEVHSVEDLFMAPIRYRIAKKWTVDQFARRVEINARQIFRYEKENYQNATSGTIRSILNRLGLKLDGSVHFHR